jgi:hypothetical protein
VLDLGKPDDKKIIRTTPVKFTRNGRSKDMQVSWQYDKLPDKCGRGYALIGGGIACLKKPHKCEELDPVHLGPDANSFYRYHYTTGTVGVLNMYVILPEGHTIGKWGPEVVIRPETKSVNNRVVLIWKGKTIDCQLQIEKEKTGNRADDEVKRIERRSVPVALLPWFRFPRFPRDLGVQLSLLAVGPAIAAVNAIPGVTGTTIGNLLLYAGLGLLVIIALLIGAVRIGDWIQK